jgi:hypothetical protein
MRAACRAIFLNPTVLHSWYNFGLLREELALYVLRNQNLKSKDVGDALSQLSLAKSLFENLIDLLTKYQGSAHISSSCALPISIANLGSNTPEDIFKGNIRIAPDLLRNVAPELIPFSGSVLRKQTTHIDVQRISYYYTFFNLWLLGHRYSGRYCLSEGARNGA